MFSLQKFGEDTNCIVFFFYQIVTKILPLKMNKLKILDSNIDIYILQYSYQLSYSFGDYIFFIDDIT